MRAITLIALLTLGGSAGAQSSAKPWIGLALAPGDGVVVERVLPETPAARAGLREGDRILAIDGAEVATATELIARIQTRGVGQTVTLRYLRGKARREASMALEPRPDELALIREHLVDKPAPRFALDGLSGPVRLDALAGNVVVVEFWATWCSACNASLPRLAEWQKRHGARGLRVVGISDESLDVVGKHVAGKGAAQLFASDPDGKTAQAYRVPAVPTFVIIDRKGRVRHVDVGGGSRLDGVEAAFLALLQET